MEFIRREGSKLACIVVAGVCLVAAGLVAGGSPEDLLKQARTQYAQHNYKSALSLADNALAGSPAGDVLRGVQHVKALSMCKLHQNGYGYGKQIMAEHEPLKQDADLWAAMGEDRGRSKEAYECYTTAGEIYEKRGNADRAADVYFKAAEILQQNYFLAQPVAQQQARPARPWNWDEQRRHHIAEAIGIYEHIVTLKIKPDRKADALHLAGQVATQQGDWKLAERGIELFRRCVKEFPGQPQAPSSQFKIGQTLEQFARYVEAIQEYRRAVDDFAAAKDWVKQARQRIDAIQAPQVRLWIEKSYLPGEKPAIHWHVRNIGKLHLKARPVDLVAAVQKVSDFGSAMAAIASQAGPPVKEWTFTTPDEGKHQFHQHVPSGDKQTTAAIDFPVAAAGAYVVEADGSNPAGLAAQAHCLVVLSKIAAIAKGDADEVLVFANDAVDGTPAGDAEVAAVRRYWTGGGYRLEHKAGRLNDAGLADLKLNDCRNCQWLAAVRKGDDQALCAQGMFYWSWWGYQNPYLVYGFTERPVYRPGQSVHFKQIIRRSSEGVYHNVPNQKVGITVQNPKGESIYAKELVTDEFGSVEGDFVLPDNAPLGMYYINVNFGGQNWHYRQSPGNRFRVEEYKKPEFKVTVEPAKSDYRVGEAMKIKVSVRYYFGQPVAGAEVKFTVRKQSYTHRHEWPRDWPWYYDEIYYGRRWGHWRPWWRPRFDELVATGTVTTDAHGEAFVDVKADPIRGHETEDLKFVVATEATDSSRRVIRGSGEVKVTHAPFFVYPRPAVNVYAPGDSVEIRVQTANPSGQGVAGEFEAEAWRIERIRKADGFEEKLAQKLHSVRLTVPATGRASVRFTPDVTGPVKVIIRQAQPENGRPPVEGSCELWIASRTGAEAHYAYNDLQIVPSSDQVEVDQKMKVLINTRFADSRVLLTGEADDLLFSRVVHVAKNSALAEIDVGDSLCPNFRLTATLIRDNRLLMDSKEIVVPPTHKFIKVATMLDRGDLGGGEDNKFQPREKTTIRVKLTDLRTGKPVRGQVALMLVDSSVYYIQPEFREAIEKAFYGFTRHVRVQTTDSFVGPKSLSPYHHGYADGAQGGYIGAPGGPPQPSVAPAAWMSDRLALREPMAKGMKSAEEAAPKLADTIIREHFQDTVLWAGSVVTADDGTAAVPVTMPDQLTTFALHALSFDADTRVGQVQADVITTKRVIVRLAAGRFFTEGDHSYVTVIAHNYYDRPQDLKVDLAAEDALQIRRVNLGGTWRDYSSGEPLDVTVPAGGEARLDFQTTAVRPGEVTLLARARGVLESDALKLTKPIVPWGARKIVAHGGVLAGDKAGKAQASQFAFVLPEAIGRGSQSLTVTLNPSVAAVAMESLPYLAQYPYGCVEQTMSRFLPTVVMRKTLQEAGVSLDEIRRHVEREVAKDPKLAGKWALRRQRMGRNPVYSDRQVEEMIAQGLDRLAKFQHPDGSWGWWQHDRGDPYMTAYVLYGLLVARDCDVKVPGDMIDRGLDWLTRFAERPKIKDLADWWWRHMDNDNTRAFLLHVIGRARPAALKEAKLKGHLDRIYEGRDDLSDYGRALLALAMHAAGRKGEAKTIVQNFENTAAVDKANGDAFWGRPDGWWYWYDGAAETTCWVLQAMLTVSPKDKHVPLAVHWLVGNRRELYWYNTKTTAMAVYALARYAKVAGELDCDQTYQVFVDGQPIKTVRVTRENLFTFDDWLVLGPEEVAPGRHTVRVARTGKGSLYWGAFLRYFDKADVIKAGGHRLALERQYLRLVPEKFDNTRTVWRDGREVVEQFPDIRYRPEPLAFGDEVASGELIEVRIGIDASENLEYVLFEDAKPSGCEPYRLTSGSAYGDGAYANMELRDTKVVFFASWLGKGKRSLSYRLVCEQPGTFRVLPTAGEAMYSPFVEAISDSGKLVITTGPDK